MIPQARQYISYLQGIVELHEQQGGAIDFEQIPFQSCGTPVSPDVRSTMNTPGFFSDATWHMTIGQENDDNGSVSVMCSLSGSRQLAEDAGAGLLGQISHSDHANTTDLQQGSMIQRKQASASAFGNGPTSGAVRRRRLSATSALEPKSPRSRAVNLSQESLIHKCCTEIRDVGTAQNVEAIMAAVGNPTISSLLDSDYSVPKILEALDKTDALIDYGILMRRMLLLCLANVREKTEADVKRNRCETEALPGTRKPESEALDMMVKEAFPATRADWTALSPTDWRKKYDAQRKCIQNRLYAAKNWKMACNRFGCGVIILFPTKYCRFVALPNEYWKYN